MENISLFVDIKKDNQTSEGPRSHWEEIVEKYTREYNRATANPKYHITEKRMAMKLSPLYRANGEGWMDYYFNTLLQARNFAARLNYDINPKNIIRN